MTSIGAMTHPWQRSNICSTASNITQTGLPASASGSQVGAKWLVIGMTAIGVVICGVLVAGFGSPRDAIRPSDLAAAAAVTGPVAFDQIDHSAWDQLLHKFVDQDGMVNYRAWKATAADTKKLERYLAALSQVDPARRASRSGQIAFWINAYNALTVHGILQVYPTTSIRKHTAVAFGYNIWKDLLLPIGGQKYSLNDMEHKILRKAGEPRIHFAIVCASIGCPRLRNEAYSGAQLETQLADNARDFFSRRKNLQADPQRREVRVSAILKWFGTDFAPAPKQALARLAAYMPTKTISDLARSGDFQMSFLDYNWDLNGQH